MKNKFYRDCLDEALSDIQQSDHKPNIHLNYKKNKNQPIFSMRNLQSYKSELIHYLKQTVMNYQEN